jgi:hypothetical protein
LRLRDADTFLLAYLAAREARFAIRSPALSITGSTSACCKAETYERFGRLYCFRCRRPCNERTWTAPRSGAVSRGGWDQVFVSETRSVDGESEQRRRWQAWIDFRPLERLFSRPPAARENDWNRLLCAWSWYSHPVIQREHRTSEAQSAVAAEYGKRQASAAESELWTADNVRTWVGMGRRVVSERLRTHPSRYPVSYVRSSREDRFQRLLERVAGNDGDRAA